MDESHAITIQFGNQNYSNWKPKKLKMQNLTAMFLNAYERLLKRGFSTLTVVSSRSHASFYRISLRRNKTTRNSIWTLTFAVLYF
jgi:hypothetical protein